MTAPRVSRRSAVQGLAATMACAYSTVFGAEKLDAQPSLGAIAEQRGLLFGASFAVHELDAPYGEQYASLYQRDARVLTSELEFKMSALRPTADEIDFDGSDKLVDFAEQHGMSVRAHTLIWNDDLPDWIHQLSKSDCEALLEKHIQTTIDRYRDRVAIWDVVNEPIGPWDRNPGNLRGGPFYSALGEGYIKRAFDLARAAAPKAKLVLNEAQTETNDANGQTFRSSLFSLLTRLKDQGAPIDAVGIQSHLKVMAPNDFPLFAAYLSKIADLGYALHITEMDVNDTSVAGSIATRDQKVAETYERYLTEILKLPAVKVVQLWQLTDRTSWITDAQTAARLHYRADARPLVYDTAFQKKPAWEAVARALSAAPKR